MKEVAALNKFFCPACGGEAVWNPARRALLCPYCGVESAAELAQDASRIREHDLASALGEVSAQGVALQRVSVQCQSCKAVSLFKAQQVANRCEFCGSSAVVPYTASQGAIYPESVIPFKQPESAVRENIRAWYKGRWFAPNKLKSRALVDTIHGLYIPYWTFDAHADASWTAESGYYYYVTETYRDSKGQTQTRQVRKIRWTPSAGQLEHFFNDDMVPATLGVHDGLLRRVQHFPAEALVPFDTGYVSGWVVEQYQVDLPQAAQISREQMDAMLRSLCAQQVPGDTHRNLVVHGRYSRQTFKHILVPVWLLTYTYGRKSYQVVVNGWSGAMAGEYPRSWVKITFAVLGALLLVLIFLFFYSQ